MNYYDKPILIEATELDCEPHQAKRGLFRFDIADDAGLDVIAKMSEEGGVYVARAYVSDTDAVDVPTAIVDKCLNKAKTEIVEQFELEKLERQKGEREL